MLCLNKASKKKKEACTGCVREIPQTERKEDNMGCVRETPHRKIMQARDV